MSRVTEREYIAQLEAALRCAMAFRGFLIHPARQQFAPILAAPQFQKFDAAIREMMDGMDLPELYDDDDVSEYRKSLFQEWVDAGRPGAFLDWAHGK